MGVGVDCALDCSGNVNAERFCIDATRRRGTIRTDGFVSVHADAQGGEMLTRPVTFDGSKLIINYATSAIGSLRFELCDADGKPVRLRVRLKDADRYSFRFVK